MDELTNTGERATASAKTHSAGSATQGVGLHRSFAEYASDFIWTMDMSLRYTYVSPSVTSLLGYTVEEAMDLSLEDLMDQQYIDMAASVLAEELSVQQAPDLRKSRTLELEVKRKDGSTVWVESRMKFVRDTNGERVGISGISRDITERKQAQQKIEHLTRLLRAIRNVNQLITKERDRDALLEAACRNLVDTPGYDSAWVCVFGERGRPVSVAQAGLGACFMPMEERLMGGNLSSCGEKASKRPGVVVTRASTRACGDCPLLSCCASSLAVTTRLECDGKVYGVLSIVAPLWLKPDAEERMLLQEVAMDIAFALQTMESEEERRGAEEALKESEELSRGLLEAVTVGTYIVQDGKFQYVNPQFQEITGYTGHELLGTQSLDYVHPEDRETVRGKAIDCLKGRSSSAYEYRYLRKDGDVLWILERVASIVHRGRLATVGSFMDITERKRAEHALRDSEEKYRNLVERANDGILIIQGGIIKYANQRLAEMGGYTLSDLIGVPFISFVHPDEVRNAANRYKRRMAGETLESVYETVLRRKDRSDLHAEINAGVVTYDDSAADLVFVRDTTERRKAEENARQSEIKYHTALESARDGIIIIDSDGIVVDVNQTCLGALGCNSKDEVVGSHVVGLLAPETQREMEQGLWGSLLKTLAEGKGYVTNLELVARSADGRQFPIEVNVSRLSDERGQGRGGVIVIRDITERKRVEKQLLDHTMRLEALHAISATVIQSLDLDTMLKSALDKVLEVIGANAGYIHLFDTESRELVLKAQRGLSQRYIEAIGRLSVREEAMQRWATYPEPSFRPDGIVDQLDDRSVGAADGSDRLRILVSIPLWSKSGMQGGLTLVGNTSRHFAPEELDLLKAIGNEIAVGIENARLLGRTRQLSITDELTGLHNRRHFYEVLENEMNRTQRYGHCFSLVMVDLDGFKEYNDKYGHTNGDTVLRSLAQMLKSSLRKSDTAFRYGGDEFIIILPGTEVEKAKKIVDRIRDRWLEIPKAESAALDNPLGFSAGIGQYPDDAETADGLIFLADTALYHSKRTGGYRSTIVSDLPSLASKHHDRATLDHVYALSATVDARDPFTYGHSERVATIAEMIGRAAGLPPEELTDLEFGALLHDIGKVGVPDSILTKPDKLTEKEWRVMRKHPGEGAKIIGHVKELASVVPMVRHHHEWYDGSGYPDGLKGEEIPICARIISIADAYDTMTTLRPYRVPMSQRAALEELRRCSGTQFDPELVEYFARVLSEADAHDATGAKSAFPARK